MPPRENVSSIDTASAMREVRTLRQEFRDHDARDVQEFRALRSEQEAGFAKVGNEVAALALRQADTHEDMQTILGALRLKTGDEKRTKPMALMGQWETIFKLGSAMSGLLIIWKMVEAAAPHLWTAIVAINQAAIK